MFGNPLLDNYIAQQFNPMNQIGTQLAGSMVNAQSIQLEQTKTAHAASIAKLLKDEKASSEPNAAVIEFYENQLAKLNAM